MLLGDEPGWIDWRRARGLTQEALTWRTARDGARADAVRFPEVATVRTPRVAGALLAEIVVEASVPPSLDALRAQADVVVVATGAWAGDTLAELGVDVEVAPRRGQMMLFASGDLDAVVMEPADGVPGRAAGRRQGGGRHHARGRGIRPRHRARGPGRHGGVGAPHGAGARRGRGRMGGLPPLVEPRRPRPSRRSRRGWSLAVGHFRNGLLLAPATGELVADLVLGRAPRVAPEPFSAHTGPDAR